MMISAKGSLIGNINSKQTLSGSLNKNIEIKDPITQEKSVIPTRERQIIEPDDGYTGLSKVTVDGYTPIVDKKTIVKNGVYKASDENLDGYSEVSVETSGVDIYDYFEKNIENTTDISQSLTTYIKKVPSMDTSKTTNFAYFFNQFNSITEIPLIDTSNGTNFDNMFSNCKSLVRIPELNTHNMKRAEYMFCNCNELISMPQLDTSNARAIGNMFQGCRKLTTIPLLNTSKVTAINYTFAYCSNLTNFGGLENIGEAYSTTQSANFIYYSLNLSDSPRLTHESLLNVINNLYDIKTKGCNAQKLVLGTTNLAKLTAEEIAIATEKGWTVS